MMDPDPLAPLEGWLTATLAELSPPKRTQILRRLGRELRKRNQQRIGRQVGPDGKPWAPRKRDLSGKVRRTAAMMQKLRDDRRMMLTAGPGGVEIGWSGITGRIASVHHTGDVDEVWRGGANVKYPARELLGLSDDDLDFVKRFILDAADQV
ncbi:MAG: phage virion morphogenesis protein [Alphaproteobacteria bacterium]|nr:phage virion morphogenesis protein [Alphaproteobacteria bacterium]